MMEAAPSLGSDVASRTIHSTGTVRSWPGRRPVRQRGQALTEFALVAPLLLVVLFGIIDGGLLLFTVGSARFAAADGARVAAQLGNATNADTSAVQTIRTGPLGQTALASVTHVDIYRLTQGGGGALSVDATAYNSYRIDGSTISQTWPPSSRDTQNGASDFLGLTVYYTYGWKSGSLLGTGSLQLASTVYVRVEPNTY